MNNILIYDTSGQKLDTLTQWDRDIYITIHESNILSAYNIHFFNKELDIAYVVESTYSDGILTVKIPNVLLMKPLDIMGYVFKEVENSSGQSIARFRIGIKQKPKPSDTIYINEIDYIAYSEILENCTAFEDAEELRVSAENTRLSSEIARIQNEQSRVSAESDRVSAESTRVSDENARILNESFRQTSETTRVNAEENRNLAEQNRVAAWANALGIQEIILEDSENEKEYMPQMLVQDGHIVIKFTDIT